MPAIVADDLAQSAVVPQGMTINPIFDWSPLLGVPLWVFITIALVVFGPILVNIYYFRKVGRLSAIYGWLESLQKMTQDDVQVWIISRVQRLTIECMTIKDNVLSFHEWEKIEMWQHNSPMARIVVGGNPGLVVSEDYHHTRDFISEIALTHNCDVFNTNQEDLKAGLIDKNRELQEAGLVMHKPMIVEPIIDYLTYDHHGRECLFHLYPNGLKYPSFNIFNPTRFRKYFPLGNSATHLGGDVIEDSKEYRIRRKEPGFLEKYLIFGTCAVIGLVMIAAAWFIPLKVG
jgi:hypothetical protein